MKHLLTTALVAFVVCLFTTPQTSACDGVTFFRAQPVFVQPVYRQNFVAVRGFNVQNLAAVQGFEAARGRRLERIQATSALLFPRATLLRAELNRQGALRGGFRQSICVGGNCAFR